MFGCVSRPSLYVHVSHHAIYTWMLANSIRQCVFWMPHSMSCCPCASTLLAVCHNLIANCSCVKVNHVATPIWGESFVRNFTSYFLDQCSTLTTVCQSFMSGEILSHLWRISLLANVLPFTLLPKFIFWVHSPTVTDPKNTCIYMFVFNFLPLKESDWHK